MIPSYQTLEKIEKRYECTISVLYKQIYDAIHSFKRPILDYEIYKNENLKYPDDHKYIIIHASDEIKQQNPIYKYRCNSFQYYSWKSPLNIAEQAVENPDSVTDREVEILGYCGGDIERDLLEKSLPHNNPIYYELYFMSFLKNPIGINKIRNGLAESEKTFLNSFNFEIPFLPKFYLLRNLDKTGFYAEKGHIIHLRFHNSTENYYQNLIPSFHEKIGDLKYLQSLETYNLSLINLPESFGNLKNLQILKLREQNLESLPESFGNLKNLQYFSINGRGFSSLPGKIEFLPESFGNLKNLTELTIVSTLIHGFPESFGNLISLEKLISPRNHLYSLPESFGNLKSLKNLDIRQNQICSLPKNFGNLISLEELKFSQNALFSLSANFGNLKNLKNLDLEENSILYLPESFGTIPCS